MVMIMMTMSIITLGQEFKRVPSRGAVSEKGRRNEYSPLNMIQHKINMNIRTSKSNSPNSV
jgi:hypothetical protein